MWPGYEAISSPDLDPHPRGMVCGTETERLVSPVCILRRPNEICNSDLPEYPNMKYA